MTSLLPPRPTDTGDSYDESPRRPLFVVAVLGGFGVAALTLLVLCALTVVGWFLTDSGNFGEPRDAVEIGSVLWVVAQGSGIHIDNTAVTMMPLGLTFFLGWALWRGGLKVGEAVSGHGPDADRIADGERDWTVPGAVATFVLTYALAVGIVGGVANTDALALSVGGAVITGMAIALVCGGAGISVGSGRAAIWTLMLPDTVRVAIGLIWQIFRTWLALCLVLLVLAMVWDFSTAANLMSQVGSTGAQSFVYAVATLIVVPNALAATGAFVLGPGFMVGTGTVVAPSGVALGPLPMFPLFAALPDQGIQPGWMAWLSALAVVVAVVVVVRAQRRVPTMRWSEGLIRGLIGGVGAGLLFGLLMHWSGGGIGPGRMVEMGPHVGPATLWAVALLGAGGLLGGLVMTWWQRRHQATR